MTTKPETRGRKPLPADKRRVQRTVSLDFGDFFDLSVLAEERGQTVPQVIECAARVYLSTIKKVPETSR